MMRLWVVLLIAGIATGCASERPTSRPPPRVVAPPVARRSPPAPVARPRPGLYALDEALADALSGPLQYIDTGPWHNIQRLHACAYHNDRVVVVNVYCSVKETTAARIDIYSPTRGYVRLYAEASAPISQLNRRDYFSFKGDSQ